MEMAGPTKNGGIGTHCYYLAKFLRKNLQHEVTVLLGTPVLMEKDSQYWSSYFKDELDISFEHFMDYPAFSETPSLGNMHYGHDWSLNLYQRLSQCSYDICHFQENNANGFVSALAKKAGLHFRNTLFTCTIHSPSKWIRQANRVYSHAGGKDLHMDFMERKTAEMCDHIVTPVNYMLDYVLDQGWNIKNKARAIPLLIDNIEKAPVREFNKKHLIFFGRLETRKGLEIFVDALALLAAKKEFQKKNLKITFLGKPNLSYGPEGLDYLRNHQSSFPKNFVWEFHTDFDHFQATNYLREHSDALVVIPSLVDNSPYTVIESLEMGLNVISTHTGGIPELFGSMERLSPPTPQGVLNKLTQAFNGELAELSYKRYSREKAEKGWGQFIKFLEDEINALKKGPAIATASSEAKTSVLLTQSKENGQLEKSLHSLEKQSSQNFNLIVHADKKSDAELNSLKNAFKRDGWSFQNRPIELSQFESDYLIFMEDDCLAEPDMVETMQNAICSSQSDAMTSYYHLISKNGSSPKNIWQSRYFLGSSPEIGLLQNCFGEKVFIIQSKVFQSLGGFTSDPENITPEWEFFVRFTLQGHDLGVIPKCLFQKRLPPHAGRSPSPFKYYYSHMKSIELIINELGQLGENITESFLGVDQLNDALNNELYCLKKSLSKDSKGNGHSDHLTDIQNNYYHLLKFPFLYKRIRKNLINFFVKN